MGLNELMSPINLNICLLFTSLDILVQMNLGFYIKGIHHDDRVAIIANYFKNKFIKDAIILIPLIFSSIIPSFLLLLYFSKIDLY